MKTLLIGTNNRHKVKEISDLLKGLPFEIKSLLNFPNISPVDETGKTLEENAILKAKAYGKATSLLTIADDTGLEVPSLNGAPGVFSARYAGEQCSFKDNNQKLIKELSQSKLDRTAQFRCVIACYDPEKDFVQTVEGILKGEILDIARGTNGFGYDPIFLVPRLAKTLAELSLEEKNRVSHRALALFKAKELLKNVT
jgi:XTP/dITP diphosphohydrolase